VSSIQPLSSAPTSGLVWEIDAGSTSLFGDTPWSDTEPEPVFPTGGRLSKRLAYLRQKAVPRMIASLNTSQVTVIYRGARTQDANDPLATSYTTTQRSAYAVVVGPTADSLERGLLSASDYEVIIAANDLPTPLGPLDSIILDGVAHDVVEARGHPRVPGPVLWRYLVKRVAA
jgi:hypothetical protein